MSCSCLVFLKYSLTRYGVAEAEGNICHRWRIYERVRGLTRLPAQFQDLQLTLNRHAPFNHSVGQIQLDRFSGLKKISLLGSHVYQPGDIISGLAWSTSKLNLVISRDTDSAQCVGQGTWGPPTAIDSSGLLRRVFALIRPPFFALLFS